MVDPDASRAAEMASLYSGVHVYKTLEEALKVEEGVKGVWISTPTPCHKDSIQLVRSRSSSSSSSGGYRWIVRRHGDLL